MKVLITAGPTWESIDAVRYIGNRSSGRMGIALAQAAINAHYHVCLIAGPSVPEAPQAVERVNVESAAQMHAAVMQAFPLHDVLIMAAAVADYRPRHVSAAKLPRDSVPTLELEPTEDIVAAAAASRRRDQKVIAFSLESAGQIARAELKLQRKGVDLMVYNPLGTMNNREIDAVLLWPDGRREAVGCRSKQQFADLLLERITSLFPVQF